VPAILLSLLAKPTYIAIVLLGLLSAGLGASTAYYKSNYNNQLIATQNEKDRADLWQNRFAQLQTAANEQNARIAELEKNKVGSEAKAAGAADAIAKLDITLEERKKAVESMPLSDDCKVSLDMLVDHTKNSLKDWKK